MAAAPGLRPGTSRPGRRTPRPLRVLVLTTLALACGGGAEPAGPGNVLVLVADDLGIDKLAVYAEHPQPAPTPNIDALARRGVLFRNAYGAPVCSPSRAAMLTGRYPRRYGLGARIHGARGDFELSLDETTLPELLDASDSGYDHSAVGKWHLASLGSPSSIQHPLLSGFRWYAGSFANLKVAAGKRDRPLGYTFWEKVSGGRPHFTETYATTDTVDDALARIGAMREPWFLWVAFNAAHAPWSEPPESLHTRRDLSTQADVFDAMVEALDSEIGRLLRSMDAAVAARTTVIFVSDNGTPVAGLRPPGNQQHRKGTLYQAGVRVPLIIAGPAVSRQNSESAALVHLVDVFATVAELAGIEPERAAGLQLDGHSLLPQLEDPSSPSAREYVYQDQFRPNGPGPYEWEERMVGDGRYKLIETAEGKGELYDLQRDPGEVHDLLPRADPEQQQIYMRLRRAAAEIAAGLEADALGR